MSARDTTAITNALRKPFERHEVKQRPAGGGRSVDYVEGHTVITRLIEATGNQFDVKVLKIEQSGELYMATVEVTIPGLGSRQHIGVQLVRDRDGEDIVKGCVTDAIKKVATLFGVGLELYEDDPPAARPATQQRPQATDDEWNVPPHPQSAEARRGRSGGGGSGRPATDKQVGFIKGLADEQKISRANLNYTLVQRYGHDLDGLTSTEASETIEALREGRFNVLHDPKQPQQATIADDAPRDHAVVKITKERGVELQTLARDLNWKIADMRQAIGATFGRLSELNNAEADALEAAMIAEAERRATEFDDVEFGDEAADA